MRELARFHAVEINADEVTDIARVFPELTPDHLLPEPDVAVEDAGLFEPIDDPLGDQIPVCHIEADAA